MPRKAHQNTFGGESIHFDVDRRLPYKYMSMSNYAKYSQISVDYTICKIYPSKIVNKC